MDNHYKYGKILDNLVNFIIRIQCHTITTCSSDVANFDNYEIHSIGIKGEVFMKLWFRKISVVLITIMTLGLYVPPGLITTNAENTDKNIASIAVKENIEDESVGELAKPDSLDLINASDVDKDVFLEDPIVEKAKDQVITKLGPRIVEEVQDQFVNEVLPQMEEVLNDIYDDGNEEAIYYKITEYPTSGVGEKIFNIYDYRTNKDIALFHVRRDKRPLEGYWFNFHYHLSNDGFEEHHEIGEIYWDKNDPPMWMS